MGDEDDTAQPESAPPPEPQKSVHSEPEEPADRDDDSQEGATRD